MSLKGEDIHHDQPFPLTAWTVVLTARDPSAPAAREARESLCQAYWRPIFSYLAALGLSKEEAEDATQVVLKDFCSGGMMDRLDRSKGRLRHFFKAAARHALANQRRHFKTQKRGSGQEDLPLEDLVADDVPAECSVPEAAFDQEWAWAIFARSMKQLEESYSLRGKSQLLEALKPCLISPNEISEYAGLGARFGVGEAQIRLETHRLRRRLAERLRMEVAATLGPGASQNEVEEETRYVVRSLAYEK